MYFFASDLEFIPYGSIKGSCKKGDIYETAQKWLSQYCNFFPQLFVSFDKEKLTAYSETSDKVLFGFKSVRGFPVKYDPWLLLLGILINLDTNNFRVIDQNIVEGLKELRDQGEIDFSGFKTLDVFLKKVVFRKSDQFVVSSLDLRKSEIIICKNEVQRATLVRKGFPFSQIKVSSRYSMYRSQSR